MRFLNFGVAGKSQIAKVARHAIARNNGKITKKTGFTLDFMISQSTLFWSQFKSERFMDAIVVFFAFVSKENVNGLKGRRTLSLQRFKL
jgi:hypothetical protein